MVRPRVKLPGSKAYASHLELCFTCASAMRDCIRRRRQGSSLAESQAATTQAFKVENHDPEKAKLITTDVGHFWRAYALARPNDKLDVFDREYFNVASAGLKDFMQARDLNPCTLWDAIQKRPKYYAQLRASTGKLEAQARAIRQVFARLKDIYPPAIFPDVTFSWAR